MELNGIKFSSFRKLAQEFKKECDGKRCDECRFGDKEENTSTAYCFASYLEEMFKEKDQAADEEKWKQEMEKISDMAEFLQTRGFTKDQACGITAILSDFVMKDQEESEKEEEWIMKETAKKINESLGAKEFFENIGKAIRKGFDAAIQEDDKDEQH